MYYQLNHVPIVQPIDGHRAVRVVLHLSRQVLQEYHHLSLPSLPLQLQHMPVVEQHV